MNMKKNKHRHSVKNLQKFDFDRKLKKMNKI